MKTNFRAMKLARILENPKWQRRMNRVSVKRAFEMKNLLLRIQDALKHEDPHYFNEVYWHKGIL